MTKILRTITGPTSVFDELYRVETESRAKIAELKSELAALRAEHAAMEEELSLVLAERAALLRDKARLDWLDRVPRDEMMWDAYWDGMSLRDAIDAAMREETEHGG